MANNTSEPAFGLKDFPPLPPPQSILPPPQPPPKSSNNNRKKKGPRRGPLLSSAATSLLAASSDPAATSSPTLARQPQGQLEVEAMHKASFPPGDKSFKGNRTTSQATSNPRRPQDTSRSQPGPRHSPHLGRGANLIPSTVTPREASSSNSKATMNSSTQTSTMPRNNKDFQDRIDTLLNRVYRDPEMSMDTKNAFDGHLKAIAQEYDEQNRRLQDSLDRATMERRQTVDELKIVREDLNAVTAERDSALREVERQRDTVAELRSVAAAEAQRLGRMQESWRETHGKLEQQISFKDEQLKGKRALWMDSNPGSSAKRDAMNAIRDPFSSPTTAAKTGVNKENMGGMGSPAPASPLRSSFNQVSQYHAPPPFSQPRSTLGQLDSLVIHPSSQRGLRKRGNFPIQRARQSTLDTGLYAQSQSTAYKTEPGSWDERDAPPPVLPSIRDDMRGWSDDAIAEYYQDEFAKLFAMIEGWVKTYCSQPNPGNDRNIASTSQELWLYMLNCAYPGQHNDSHHHVITLLNDARSRCWFVMRMIIAFCVKEVLAVELYYTYSAKIDAELNAIKTKLQERGLNTEARQKLIDQLARIIEEVLGSEECTAWRNKVLNSISKRLRDMVGGLLNDGADRGKAGSDLGAIGMFAWKLSNDIHTSHLTFQIFFPETASKFNASTMVAKEPTRYTALELQIKQMRLKLVITPVVTLRDDRSTTIKAKSLHHATVLTMN